MFLTLDDLQRLLSVSLQSVIPASSNNCSYNSCSFLSNSKNSNVSVLLSNTGSHNNTNSTPVVDNVVAGDTSHGETVPVIVNHRKECNYGRGRNLANLVQINNTKQNISYGICVLNARSLFPKASHLPSLFDQLEIAIISVSESWQHNPMTVHERQIVDQLKNIYGINYIGAPRTNKRRKRGGGVAILYLEKFFTGEEIELNPPPHGTASWLLH